MALMRLDKLLALQTGMTRREAAACVRQGAACLQGQPVRNPAQRVDPRAVTLNGKNLGYEEFVYLLMHKPAGVLTAARDKKQPTVLELVPQELYRRGVQPVGRLDKDTTGLLLLTDDGALAHRLLSPQHHVWKTYLARLSAPPCPGAEERFAAGVVLPDFTCLPAKLTLVQDGSCPVYEVRVHEGKYHQVKRMFLAQGCEVLALQRVGFGPLRLPADLPPGRVRPLLPEERQALLETRN
ncbi:MULTISPECIES: pseudouridine synthase [Caproicibacterium]|uniref:Pseudouridine synthase n=1 Tax=Caproicibacterium argilliputei TaxID=3030016 RepID=A0AA97DAR9_9FIRM|nr:pseudouridine synthase [Caproicibacterium argilliputei]WOC32429.1 pseudouridine synthase [Caproicibacterium argilliputei]